MSHATPIAHTDVLKLLLASKQAKENAYAPYSKFRVGAALLTSDNEIILGCNVENASYGAGICAERTALVSAVSQGKKSFRAIAVASDVNSPTVSPCGICRQFIREFSSLSLPIYMIGENVNPIYLENLLNHPENEQEAKDFTAGTEEYKDSLKMMTLGELLPMSFGPENLGKEVGGK